MLAATEGEEGLIEEETDPNEQIDQVQEYVPETFESMVTDAGLLWGVLIGIGVAFLFALVITVVTSTILKQIFRRSPEIRRAINRTRIPLLFAVTAVGARLAVGFVARQEVWFPPVSFALIVVIAVGLAWWALRLVGVVEAFILAKYIGEGAEADIEDRRGRRLQTQVSLIRRILTAVIITLAVAAVLLSIEQVRALGVGMLASAGVVSVVAGLAMQSTLTNLFAGIQLAFTDSIRVGDVVVVEENFVTVEDITLSVVVLKSWTGQRFIYPSAYFVNTPFENWTRVGTEMMGTVELEVDWRVPMDALRARLKQLVATTDLWDGREVSVQVTEALGGTAKAAAVVSARNSGELWDLQCLVREDFVNFLRAEYPFSVVTQRMLISNDETLAQQPEPVQTGQTAQAGKAPQTEKIPQANKTGQTGVIGQDRSGEDASGQVKEELPEEEFLKRYGSAGDPPPGTGETPLTTAGEGASIFTGSISAVERNREFSGPGEDAYRERRERQEENDGLGVVPDDEAEDEDPPRS